MRLEGRNIRVDLPSGWEGEIEAGLQVLEDGAVRPTVIHVANFPLPPGRGHFAIEVLENMVPGDVILILFEYGAESLGTALFEDQGLPTSIQAPSFAQDNLARPRLGMSGLQRFFTHANRPFCLHIVVGSHIDRRDVLQQINSILSSVVIT